ncbi:MAG TPA: hypothetical protein VHY08_10035, partial [Bacillota bacterium]|nr:hypothetical protein [Bacillota bacterium]
LQVFGGETSWPTEIDNFVTGVDQGEFTPAPGMPPDNAEMLRQTALSVAHNAAGGPNLGATHTLFYEYQGLFNSLWDSPTYAGMSDEFDNALDSHGPRTERSREIFDDIYASNATIQVAYDQNTGGIRALIDQYVGPDSRNMIASPRLQALRRLFLSQGLINSNNPGNATYLAFKTTITPAAQSLDINDRNQIEGSHEWRLIIDRTVSGAALRRDLSEFLATAWQSAPIASTATSSSTSPATTTTTPTHTGALTADQQNFVNNLSLQGPSSPINSNQMQEQLIFTPRSSRNPAGLHVQSRVAITPAAQVITGQQTQHPWPAAATTGSPHSATVNVDGGTTGAANFTGSLSLFSDQGQIPLSTPRQATVQINDQRRAWFTSNIEPGLIYSEQNIQYLWLTGTPMPAMQYYGGQNSLKFQPFLRNNLPNRGLEVFVQVTLSRNGVNYYTSSVVEFGRESDSRNVGGVTVLESATPLVAPDNMDLIMNFYPSSNVGNPPFHSIPLNFQISPGGAYSNAAVLAQAVQDYNDLNSTSPGGVLDQMANMTGPLGPQAQRTAEAISTLNVIKLEPCLVRADSAQYVSAHSGNPREQLAYLVGHTVVNDFHTLVGGPAAAWQWGQFPNTVFVNYTLSLANPLTKRPLNQFVSTIIHETVHAMDIRPLSNTNIELYKTEFRAYWMDGDFDGYSTAFDPGMSNQGPKSPRARAIFDHLYGSTTYPWVKNLYDNNTNQFRDQVNAYIVPDGINLINSVRLEALRAMINSFNSSVNFATHLTAIQNHYNTVCNADDQQEISGNRSWRELVERKYNNTQEPQVKSALNIL